MLRGRMPSKNEVSIIELIANMFLVLVIVGILGFITWLIENIP